MRFWWVGRDAACCLLIRGPFASLLCGSLVYVIPSPASEKERDGTLGCRCKSNREILRTKMGNYLTGMDSLLEYIYILFPLLSKSPRNSMCLVCFVNDRELIFTIAIFFFFCVSVIFLFCNISVFIFLIIFFSLFLFFFSLPNLFPFSTYENYTSLGLRLWVAHSQLNTPIKNESHKRLDWFAFIGRWCSRTASRAPSPSTSIGWPGQPRSGQSFLLIFLFCFFFSFFFSAKAPKNPFIL